uniref:Uncharacterized protein n=1 Tax=Eubacterium cellulosolvens (strain ATCC 43171 / JCM 9499 / 6) TaxID=633697 RepID=I5ASN8_EUBC6
MLSPPPHPCIYENSLASFHKFFFVFFHISSQNPNSYRSFPYYLPRSSEFFFHSSRNRAVHPETIDCYEIIISHNFTRTDTYMSFSCSACCTTAIKRRKFRSNAATYRDSEEISCATKKKSRDIGLTSLLFFLVFLYLHSKRNSHRSLRQPGSNSLRPDFPKPVYVPLPDPCLSQQPNPSDESVPLRF